MSKVRINDLARELEVKSKAILDTLPLVGVTEKKTHSSSLEEHEAEKVRGYLRSAEGASAAGKSSSRPARGEEEIKTKIDLSHISRPGDVLKAITQRKEAVAPPIAPRPVPPVTQLPVQAPAVEKPVVAPPAVAGPVPVAPKTVVPAAPPRPFIPPAIPASPVAAPPIASSPSASSPVAAPPVRTVPTPPVVAPTPLAPAASANVSPAQPIAARPAAPPPPAPRMIVPQTGPRPVYKAPVRPAPPPVQPGVPIGGTFRPAPGRPVPGQPIFQRRPPMAGGAPGAPRPPLRPGERRPMHPTRSAPAGARPLGVGPALPPPGTTRPGSRPGAPSRRPGQRYVPRGVKEGPMKGYTPPPRMVVSNEPQPITRSITITEGISVKDLAEKLEIRAKDLISRLLSKGVFATINQTLDAELAGEMARFFGADTNVITFEEQTAKEIDAAAAGVESAPETGIRPPVVTIMGHVDHGKTTLLDSIRITNVAGGEAGGITQHIGAYKVRITDKDSPAYGREIVFLDTPGHEAFTRMRSRGAKATDIVVLVVAADDGVMPQTVEAIDHAHAAEVPIIVAVNKIDKPDALPDRVKKQLADRGLVPEEWGGKTVFVDVSAKQKTNLNLLMEMICLVADLGELKATPERAASGIVLEAKLDRGRGPVATVLVQNGTLNAGDNFVVGNVYGKVRAMFDDRGAQLKTAPPSTPVEIIGMESLPQAGDQFVVVADRDKARGISEYREQKAREAALAKSSRVSLEGLAEQIKSAGTKELNIILKGDVQGSVEVITDLLTKLSNEKVRLKLLRSGVGAITETDVLLASASNAIIIGFNVRPERKAQELADQEKVDIRLHSIIYELQDEIKRAMSGLLEPTFKEHYQGRAEVLNVFRIPKVGTVAGCRVSDGQIKRDSEVRLLRDGVQVFKGKVGSLRRFKDDAKEVTNGMECGISISNYGDIKVGDTIEAFATERIAAEVIA
ncbi:MAG TPA: translation initiation factor IF-2 [Candidatus Aquilonibacter sp.]|jgi:translation initiation factor IF-2|nr:translation initiation factor IF-2 [Candidatus Aquilonibacter sp.]